MKLIQIIKSRLSGNLAQKMGYAILEVAKNNNPVSRTLLCYFFIWYFRGSRAVYRKIVKEYGQSKSAYFDFGNYKIPIDDSFGSAFAIEFFDLVFPYLYPGKYKWAQLEGTYEEYGMRVEKGDIVLDVGANIGVFSVFAASKGAQVYAFEAVGNIVKSLRQTIDLNDQFVDQINIVPQAVANKVGTAQITIDEDNWGGCFLKEIKKDRNGTSRVQTIEVSTVTLDKWAKDSGIERIDFIKADIEGAERLMLEGAQEVLRRFKPKLAISTYHLPDDPEVIEGLIKRANKDYSIYHGSHKIYAY